MTRYWPRRRSERQSSTGTPHLRSQQTLTGSKQTRWSRRRWRQQWTRTPEFIKIFFVKKKYFQICKQILNWPPWASWSGVCWAARLGRGSRCWRRWCRGSWSPPRSGTSAGCRSRRGRSTRYRRTPESGTRRENHAAIAVITKYKEIVSK